MELLIGGFISILALFGVVYLGSLLILTKKTKDFHLHFGIFKGFDFSGSFYEDNHKDSLD